METLKYLCLIITVPLFAYASNPPFRDEVYPLFVFDNNSPAYSTFSFLNTTEVQMSGISNGEISRKSPLLAGVMSAALPGTGEAYSGNWLRAAMHFGIEAGLWGLYFHFDGKGDSQTNLYQRYANMNWSVVEYAEWLNVYWVNNDAVFNDSNRPNPIRIDPDGDKDPWNRVNWSEIHAVENRIPQFSHKLDPYGTQQYYEMIGKYHQFNRGWRDSEPYPDPAMEIDPSFENSYYNDISDMFTYYSGKRGYANTLYARAHNAALGIFLNHFASAFHAAFLAHRYNVLNLSMEMQYRNDLYGERFIPTLKLQIGI